ncbi:hypothetical protein [Parvularcula sp. LCG005]|uniref:hypothetical protein n=1 Tax=Parvularcula sp. LCG005 TaxID=3078805 RepID=UPI00294232FF|nr:hypothetical protein [Parvularcula sp. LCG005]WOI52772.1 hypothetical protein RUI03_11505 [Parvularcula sp. LCG005]
MLLNKELLEADAAKEDTVAVRFNGARGRRQEASILSNATVLFRGAALTYSYLMASTVPLVVGDNLVAGASPGIVIGNDALVRFTLGGDASTDRLFLAPANCWPASDIVVPVVYRKRGPVLEQNVSVKGRLLRDALVDTGSGYDLLVYDDRRFDQLVEAGHEVVQYAHVSGVSDGVELQSVSVRVAGIQVMANVVYSREEDAPNGITSLLGAPILMAQGFSVRKIDENTGELRLAADWTDVQCADSSTTR